jgi:hypothetical protein
MEWHSTYNTLVHVRDFPLLMMQINSSKNMTNKMSKIFSPRSNVKTSYWKLQTRKQITYGWGGVLVCVHNERTSKHIHHSLLLVNYLRPTTPQWVLNFNFNKVESVYSRQSFVQRKFIIKSTNNKKNPIIYFLKRD